MTIIASIITCFLFTKLVTAQLNGEFWWLNEKLGKYVEARIPKFEDLTEFDTDESAKIVFRDNDLIRSSIKLENPSLKKVTDDSKIYFRDESSLVWPTNYNKQPLIEKPVDVFKPEDTKPSKNKSIEERDEDVFNFKFPENDNFIWEDEKKNISKTTTTEKPKPNKTENSTYKVVLVNSKVPIKVLDRFTPESENICTYLKKTDCNQKGGVVYIKRGAKKFVFNSILVCCILPLSRNDSGKIIFLDDQPTIKRYKRSNKDVKTSPGLAQRQALLLRKYKPGLQVQKTRLPPVIQATLDQKIVTPTDDYVDPYWNIKNSNFNNRKYTAIQQTQIKHDYVPDEYDDYAAELPKPGLVGLYSDHSGSPGWTFGNGNKQPAYGGGSDDVDVGEEQPSFGYGATVDPRLEDRLITITSKPQFSGRPNKVATQTTSDEYVYDIETQTINYQSNPDFQVLQGFKLFNLVHNKSKVHKNGKKTTVLNDSKETVLVDTSNNDDYDVFDTNQQVFKECGQILIKDDDKEKNIGETTQGSHPWLALVVLTRKRQTILCYATLVHNRAAVTSADCVHGRACPGEVTLIAGAWDLKDEGHENWQKRMISVHLHDKYNPGELDNNLAVLHWTRPLKLNLRVQPACLTDPHVGDDCKFYGWGGYDQEIRSRSRWQRASILTPRVCNDRLSSKKETLPSDAFCASVLSRGTVTGIGAPLVCTIGGRHAAAGIAIWRDNVVVLAPVHEWTMRVLEDLQLQ